MNLGRVEEDLEIISGGQERSRNSTEGLGAPASLWVVFGHLASTELRRLAYEASDRGLLTAYELRKSR